MTLQFLVDLVPSAGAGSLEVVLESAGIARGATESDDVRKSLLSAFFFPTDPASAAWMVTGVAQKTRVVTVARSLGELVMLEAGLRFALETRT